MPQKIYAVIVDSWWDCCDTGHDESTNLGMFTTKDLAVQFVVQEIEDIKKCFIDKYNRELESCDNKSYIERIKSEIKRIESFEYDVWAIRDEEYIDVTKLVRNEWWGDNNAYRIEEHVLLDELP